VCVRRVRTQPFQEKQDTAEYRVVYSPQVAVRDKPWGKVIASKKCGESIKTTHRTIGLPDGTWVKTLYPVVNQEPGWLLIDGKAINLGVLLEKVEAGRKGMVTRYRVVAHTCDIRERPSLAGTPVVGNRKKGALLRADQELNGFVRIQHDFYATGKAEPIEGWALVHGRTMGMGPILERWEPTNALPAVTIGSVGAQGGNTRRWWVIAAEGTPVRERPWGRVLCVKRGLLRCDAEKDGWVRIEQDFTEEVTHLAARLGRTPRRLQRPRTLRQHGHRPAAAVAASGCRTRPSPYALRRTRSSASSGRRHSDGVVSGASRRMVLSGPSREPHARDRGPANPRGVGAARRARPRSAAPDAEVRR
jgi:hypothetical protein